MARLHIICGNCGCNDEFTYEIDLKGHDVTVTKPNFEPAVWIACGNCGTVHDLNDTIPKKGNTEQ